MAGATSLTPPSPGLSAALSPGLNATLLPNNSPKGPENGANSYGQLSLEHREDQVLPKQIALQTLRVKQVTGGGGHTLAITGDGQLWTCGSNNKGQLGLGSSEDVSTLTSVPGLNNVTAATGGWDFSLAVTDDGNIHSWGSNSFMQLGDSTLPAKNSRPNKISLRNGERATSVAAGLRHSVALTTAGNVYCWGHGKKGQCVTTERVPSMSLVAKPTKVSLPTNCGQAIQIAAGSYHTVALMETGELLFWGCNKYGQSTLEPATLPQVNAPHKLETSLFTGKVIEVKSGWTHLIAKTDTGELFSWGRADYGQLGRSHDSAPYDSIPMPVPQLKNARMVNCGSEHTLAVAENGRLLSWGWNEHGICGTGDEDNVRTPQLVETFRPNVINIGCGAGHSFVVTESQKNSDDNG